MIITAGKFKGQKVIAPDESITRPTLSKVRMSIFNILQSMVNFDECSFLDMFAGSGIMGLEAVSRGFSSVLALEKNPKAFKIVKANYANILKLYSLDVKAKMCDSLNVVSKLENSFDVIYIDPPYFSGIYENSLAAIKDIALDIVILEHVIEVNFEGYEVIKQKKYGDKFITFLRNKV